MSKRVYMILMITLPVLIGAGVATYALTKDPPPPPNTPTPASPNDQTTQNGSSVTKTGTIVCLSPRDTSGPTIMSCAIGLKTDDDSEYALHTDDPSDTGGIPTGQPIEVTGQLTSQTDSPYNTSGTINVETIRRL